MIRLLIRRSATAPLSGYVEEILAVEGVLGCETVDLTGRDLTPAVVQGAPLILLGHMPLETREREVLSEYVSAGGRLIALRPPTEMAPLFGIEATGATLKRGHYLQFDSEHGPVGARSTDVPLQVHAEGDAYTLKAGKPLAWFCWGNGARRHLVAAALHQHGDGVAAMLAYDLATSTVFFHQGLPEQASTGTRPDPGALGQYKPDGHFVGMLDVTRVTIPQADLQQRLLTALIDALLPAPLPRLWYHPHAAPCLAFLNGDSDAMDLGDLEAVIGIVEPRGGRYTCYVMDEQPLSAADEAALRSRGHSFGKHVWTGSMPSVEEMRSAVQEQVAGYRDHYGYTPLSNRGHCLIWPGWTEMAAILSSAGVRMDSNFVGAHCGHGYLTGSGLPVKFMDEHGHLIDLYEQSTQWEDDVALWSYFEQLAYEQAVDLSLTTLREAKERYHTVVNFNFHPIHTRQEWLKTIPWITAVADFCREQAIPMVSGDDWVRFNDARRQVRLSEFSVEYLADASSSRVAFRLSAEAAVDGLTVTLPGSLAVGIILEVSVDGVWASLRRVYFHDAERVLVSLSLPAHGSCLVVAHYGTPFR